VKAKMHLAFDLSWTHLEGRWRVPGSWTGCRYPDIAIYKEVASIAERGCIDMLFFGDGTGIPDMWRGSQDDAVKWGIGWPRQDMSPVISVLSQTTKHLGFGITYSSTFMHPFYVSRLLNSLDHISGGRMAFNVVTSTRRADAANYGYDELMEHNSRYDRMEEFVQVCKALWASVAQDAFSWDRETGVVIPDPSKVRPINHVGSFFKVKGPLSCVPSPQGRPVLIQAGGSPRGIKASAQFADYVFAALKPRKMNIKHREELDAQLTAAGRDPSKVGILWDIVLVVGETTEEAQRRKELLLTAIPFEAAGAFISHQSGYDFSKLPARFKLKDVNAEIAATNASPVGFVHQLGLHLGEDAELTRKEFFEYGMKVATGYNRTVAGSASEVADFLEEEFEATGSRGGFMVAHPQASPRDLLNVVDFLVPELQRRGRFRTEYTGKTLMENLAA
jgi:FMN-dependent oxidoreductase (nitrilotriacetate monooxygenase family)